MIKNLFHQQHLDMPTLILQNKNFDTIGSITNASELTYKENFNAADEISFLIYKYVNGKACDIWDSIVDTAVLYVPELEERFEITVSKSENGSVQKTVTGTSLCESELSQTKLYDIEINTENDIARPDYDENYPTLFYRDLSGYEKGSEIYEKLRGSSLLHRLLEKASNYEIGHVDESLAKLTSVKQFTVNDTDIYSVLTGEIAEEYGVLFLFDSITGTVFAYDLYNTCQNCGYRGDFQDACPKCGTKNFSGQYGTDTAVFISCQNLASELKLESDASSLKNCFKIEGGDETITAAVRNINPNGSEYIYAFHSESTRHMPQTLADKLASYNALFNKYKYEQQFSVPASVLSNYNSVISYIKNYFPDSEFQELSAPINGYQNLTAAYYDTVDADLFLSSAMLPTVETDHQTIDDAMKLLTVSNLSPISVSTPSTLIKTSADNAVTGMVKVLINTALYDISIVDSSYTKGQTGTWKGKIKLTSIADKTETRETDELTIVFNDDEVNYIRQQIQRAMNKSSLNDALNITSMDMDETTFQNRLHLYGITPLTSLSKEFVSCINIIVNAKSDFEETAYQNMYDFYSKRKTYIDAELTVRNRQYSYIQSMADFINEEMNTVKTSLNLQTYLGSDLWKIFCSYRREDKYQNDNYISDGLNNAEVLARAQELYDTAQRELSKASHPQYSMTATINNLLNIPDFAPLHDSFACGNWIRAKIDDAVYRLRLISYELSFDSLESLSVAFSTVKETGNGTSDIQSILNSAAAISGSYSSLTQQVNKSAASSDFVQNWVKEGFYATAGIINNPYSQDIVIDKNGIWCRQYDDITDAYDNCQIRVFGNGLYCTDDDWKTVKAAIGKYIYADASGKHTAMGVLGETIVGELLLGEKLSIHNASGNLQFNGDGLAITNGRNTFSVNPNDTDKLLCITNGDTDIFYVDDNGSLNLTGNINGCSFDGGTINIGNGNFTVDNTGKISSKSSVSFGNGALTYDPANGMSVKGSVYINDAIYLYRALSETGELIDYDYEKTFEYVELSEFPTLICYPSLIVKESMTVRSTFTCYGFGTDVGGTAHFVDNITLENAKYIDSHITTDTTSYYHILGISSSNNLHLGSGLYDNSVDANTYVNSGNNLYLRSKLGTIRFQPQGKTNITVDESGMTIKGILTASEAIINGDSLSTLIARVQDLSSRVLLLENKIL